MLNWACVYVASSCLEDYWVLLVVPSVLYCCRKFKGPFQPWHWKVELVRAFSISLWCSTIVENSGYRARVCVSRAMVFEAVCGAMFVLMTSRLAEMGPARETNKMFWAVKLMRSHKERLSSSLFMLALHFLGRCLEMLQKMRWCLLGRTQESHCGWDWKKREGVLRPATHPCVSESIC